MKVSIIIPTYNRANQLHYTLLSLTKQTFKDFEVIVCDDGSTDNTKEVVSDFNSQLDILYSYDVNFGGPARPRNRGILLAKGEIISFLDSDDWWYPTKIEISLKYLQKYDIVYHDLHRYLTQTNYSGLVKGRKLDANTFKDLLINGNGIPNSSVMIKKSVIDVVGYFSEDKKLIAVEDSEYWLRVALVTDKFYYMQEILGAYWIGENISGSVSQIAKEEYLLSKFVDKLSKNEAYVANKFLAFRKARLYHRLGHYNEAVKNYLNSVFSPKISVAIKSIVGLIYAFFKVKI